MRLIFRPKSEIQTFFSPKFRWSPKKKKKKKKKVFTKIETDFSPDWLRLGRWGGDASRNGADLFETEADFSAKIVTFRLVGGDASPPSPPLNPPLPSGRQYHFNYCCTRVLLYAKSLKKLKLKKQ